VIPVVGPQGVIVHSEVFRFLVCEGGKKVRYPLIGQNQSENIFNERCGEQDRTGWGIRWVSGKSSLRQGRE
jgi:hypothetical protein